MSFLVLLVLTLVNDWHCSFIFPSNQYIVFTLSPLQKHLYLLANILNQTYELKSLAYFITNKKDNRHYVYGNINSIDANKGANIGVKALYAVATTFLSLIIFAGDSQIALADVDFFNSIENADNFFYVFTIIFPAFTGISAGLGLSGDLKIQKIYSKRNTYCWSGCFNLYFRSIELVSS